MIARRSIESSPYKVLQDQGLAMLQELCGNRWTDFNEHDPGVTILDALHYALLELQYLLRFPFESYLVQKDSVDFERFGLFSAEELFAPVIVTPTDYEHLIQENIREVKACRVSLLPGHRYQIIVEVEDPDAEDPEALSVLHSRISSRIGQLYHANRNLCENLESVSFGKVPGRKEQRSRSEDVECETRQNSRPETFPAFSYEHYSIQNHFPDCYGINEKGMPAGASDKTQAKIRQLQAYLLIFDYLLADTKQQVANIPQLLELSGTIPQSELPAIDLQAVTALSDTERFDKNLTHDEHFRHTQKSRYLDALDALYGEDTKRFFIDETDISVENQKRADLIRRFPQLNAIRFRASDILEKNQTSRNRPGIQQFLSAIGNREPGDETSVMNLFSRYNLRLLSDEAFFREYKNLNMEFITGYPGDRLFDYETEPVPELAIPYDDSRFYKLRNNILLFWHHLLFESFLTIGSDPVHYRIAYRHKTNGYLLIFKIPGKREWLNLGIFKDKQTLTETANLLWQFLKMLEEESQQIYLTEHILLHDAGDDYNALTFVIPYWAKNTFVRKNYESLLYERLPAHLDIRFCWLNAEDFYDFEKIYYEWREALAAQNKAWIKLTSTGLRMIIKNQEKTE